MSLRDRLRSMQGAAVAQPDSTPGMPDDLAVNVDPTAASSSTARADTVTVSVPSQPVAPALVTRMRAAYGPEALLPGTECETPHGCCFVAEWRYPLEHRHGHATLGATAGVSLAAASALLARGPREREILRLVAEGLTSKQIAQQLFLSPRTVDHHMYLVFNKLGVDSRAQAVAVAARERLL